MKILAVVLAVLLLCGCGGREAELDRAMDLRAKLVAASVSFDAEITADYGDQIHTFSVYCEGDSRGNLGFRITAPDTIADITGRIEAGEGKLTFKDMVLAFPLLADEQLSPVSAPWVFYQTLRGGYLTAAGMDGELLRVPHHSEAQQRSMAPRGLHLLHKAHPSLFCGADLKDFRPVHKLRRRL